MNCRLLDCWETRAFLQVTTSLFHILTNDSENGFENNLLDYFIHSNGPYSWFLIKNNQLT